MSVPELISQQAVRLPDKPALQIKQPGGWQRYTYRQLDESSRRVSAYLRRRGYAGGDTAVLILENCPEWAVVYLGVVRAGLTCVPLDIEIHHSEIAGIIADCAAGVLFCSRQVREGKVAGDLLKGMRDCIIVDEDAFTDILSGEPVAAAPDATGRKAPASLIYTSGTTGEPKGVVLTHENLSANVQSAIKLELINEHDNLIVLLPLHHTYPFMVNLLVPLSIGATVTFAPPGFDPRRLTAFMREAGITVLTGVPQLFSLLYAGLSVRLAHIPGFVRMLLLPVIRRAIRREFGASFRFCVSGGARLEPLVARGLSRLGIKVIEGYGLTEASPVVSFNPVNRTKPGSVGVPLPGVEVRINEPDEEGEGEILIRGANVMQGYFKHADWSAEVLRDGWLYSGDRGYLDKDGYLFITGRSKDVIVLGSGKNIYPQELESYYGRSPYIKEICILEKTQESFGRQQQSLFAVVVVDLAYFRARGEVSINEKIRWELENLGKSMPAHKHVMGFMLSRDPLPRTALNKIQRYKVREMFLKEGSHEMSVAQEAYSDDARRFLEESGGDEIIAYLVRQLKKPVYPDSHLELDLGVDSLTRVELGLGLELRFKVKIPDESLYTVLTVKDLIVTMQKLRLEQGQGAGTAGGGDAVRVDWQRVLKASASPDLLRKIRLKVDVLDWILLIAAQLFCGCILRVFWLLRVRGKENVSRQGPSLICPNHGSYLDGFAVFAALPWSTAINTYFVGYARIFELPVFRWAISRARLIPIDPDTHLVDALRAVSYVLARGKTVCIFPEGRRAVDGHMNEFKKGVGILMKELDVRSNAVYIKNSHRSWPRTSRFPRFCPITVTYGRPLTARELEHIGQEEGLRGYAAISRGLQRKVEELR